MKTIEEKINYYKESLDLFDDGMDKYKFLIDQAKNAKIFPEEYRNDSFKVSGCQAQVWLVPQLKENKLSFIYYFSKILTNYLIKQNRYLFNLSFSICLRLKRRSSI
mgnify:CR=1 FL=1